MSSSHVASSSSSGAASVPIQHSDTFIDADVVVNDVVGVAAVSACRHRANFRVKLGHSPAAADVVVEAASGRVNSASSCSRSPSSSAENSPPRTTTSSAKNFFSPSPLGLPVSFSKSSATARHLDRASL